MKLKKLCCLGHNVGGVPLCAVIAFKCPEIKVTVVDLNPENIYLWNSNEIPPSLYVYGLDDIIRKCRNRNLFFTTNERTAILDADVIFITSESKLKTCGEGKGRSLDLVKVENAAQLIADWAESDKIVVENGAIPLRTAECVSNILKHKCKPKVQFQVLSNPQFYEGTNTIQEILNPYRVLIGSEDTPEAVAAAKELACVYERWIPQEKILVKGTWNMELAKIGADALVAQRLVSANALAAICEESGSNITEVTKGLKKEPGIGDKLLNPTFGLGGLTKVVLNLIYICEYMGMTELADYWHQVLELDEYHKKRFLTRFYWCMKQKIKGRKIAVLGFALFRDTAITEGSPSIEICKYLFEEEAIVTIYDPRVTKEQIIENLVSAACKVPAEKLAQAVVVKCDPYEAASQNEVVILSTGWAEFLQLDYGKIYSDMMTPAHIFDLNNVLSHKELTKIGFKIYAVGKSIKM